ncbi:MAG: TolC family protein [Betaproteobacteria bacterium]|nr:TolC family protein [Betaproteobacteria bacterium]
MRLPVSILLLSWLLPAQADSLRDALEKAWARNPQAQALSAREAEVKARQGAAASLLPAPPALSISHKTDRWNSGIGKREWEAEIELPLWLPGEKSARLAVSAAEYAEWRVSGAALRLGLAGELRERTWNAAQGEAELALAKRRLETAQALEKDVARRVGAGDLARTDLLLARNDALTAHAAVLENEVKLAQALQTYLALTGEELLPTEREETVRDAALDTHPQLEAARQTIVLAQAKIRHARETRRDSPELSFGTLRERDAFGEPYHDRVGVKFKLPFATDARNEPVLAAAQTELTQAEAEYRQIRARVEGEIRQARQAHQSALLQLDLARRKQALAAENLVLLQKAFDLGELDLPSLLRVKALAHEAELGLTQQAIAAARSRAMLNHALGVLP